MKIKHIFFDLDHTLWDFEKNSDLAFETVFTNNNLSVSVTKFLTYYKSINQKYWKLYRDERVTKEQLRFGRLNDTFAKINYKVNKELINKLAIEYIEELPKNNYLFDGTHEILEYLQPNYQMHIITNGFNEVQHEKLLNSGINIYFDQIITSEAVGVKKPNPKIFNYALEQAKAIPSESIMIGDNWEADIMGAKNVGFDVIFCNFNSNPVGENIKSINNLFEIKQFLK
ncbi:putative hydrolase of the HAD superfamily [Lutibacter oricola]|uniref:Putative hydrolase of the HAD superfamily n=1 Tax=Lutibacter oricola TaxID=762486 RepID=A0A1H2YZP5_9FLAO|nr:YjjG family noncanonical pyrimidine nucleotidase [Lutibacter oricola]SDX10672.1 putative hydrolase of the HAD superfamily [Lutibacter oricola]